MVGQRQQPLCFQAEYLFVLLHKKCLGCVFCLASCCGHGGARGGPVTLWLTLPGSASATHTACGLPCSKVPQKKVFWGKMIKFSLCLGEPNLCDDGQSERGLPSLVGQAGISVWYNAIILSAGFLWWAARRKQGRCDTIKPELQLWKSVMALQTSEMWP